MVATWSDSDAFDYDSYDDVVANLCLMAIDDSKVTSTSCDSNIDCMKIEIDELTKKNTNLQNSFSRFYIGQ